MYKVSVAAVPGLLTWAPAWMGTEENLDTFRQACVDISFVSTPIGQTSAQVMLAGQADVAATNALAVINGSESGASMKVVAQAQTNDSILMVRDGLTTTGSPEDLVGKKIGYVGALQLAFIDSMLKSIGKSVDDVQMVQITSANTVASLASKQVDFATVVAPLDGVIIKQGAGEVWNDPRDGKDPLSDVPFGVFFSRSDALDKNADALKAFVKGVCLTDDAMRADADKAAQVASEEMEGDAADNEAAMRKEIPIMGCAVDEAGWDKMSGLFVDAGVTKGNMLFADGVWSEAPAIWSANTEKQASTS